ncbi:MAG: hypothetical protein ACKV2V_22435 [Blastocatellia bacterium]
MAQHGEWTRPGATLSDVTARKEYGVTREFIIAGIRAGKLEYREGSAHGNPYLRVLRRELEAYIAEQSGAGNLADKKQQAELTKVKREINSLKRKLAALEKRRAEIEAAMITPKSVT